jgi:preprotein translocase subunit YajC
MILNKGDKVTVLDDAIDGIVIEVKANDITIETTDGFHLTFKRGELLKMDLGELRINFNKNHIIAEKEVKKQTILIRKRNRKKKFRYPSLICTLKN